MRLKKHEKWMVYGSAVGVWLSGALWLYYDKFMAVEGEFGVEASPLESVWQTFHGAFGYAAAVVAGVLWTGHVVSGWKNRWRRWSGGWVYGVTLFLIVSGCALYYLVDDMWREWTGLAHWVVGLAALALFLAHWLSRSLPKKG